MGFQLVPWEIFMLVIIAYLYSLVRVPHSRSGEIGLSGSIRTARPAVVLDLEVSDRGKLFRTTTAIRVPRGANAAGRRPASHDRF